MKLLAAVMLAAPLWAAADPQMLALMPPDAKIVVGIDMAAAKQWPLLQPLLAAFRDERGGFDPDRDLLEFVFAMDGFAGSPSVGVVRGNFDLAKIGGVQQPARVYRGVNVYSANEDSAGAMLNGTLGVIGTQKQVNAAIDRSLDHTPGDAVLLADAARASEGVLLWIAANDPSQFMPPQAGPSNPQDQMARNLLANLRKITAGFTIEEKSIRVAGRITAKSAEEAKGLGDLLKLVMGLQPELQTMQAMFTPEGDVLNVSLTLPMALVEQALPH